MEVSNTIIFNLWSVKRKAIQIINKVKQNKFDEGRNPIEIAASTIYVV